MPYNWKQSWFTYADGQAIPTAEHPYPGTYKNRAGYKIVYGPKKSTWCEHLLLWENYHGRRPRPGYQIHHIDRNSCNNTKTNLQELTPEQHKAVHAFDDLLQRTCRCTVESSQKLRGPHAGKYVVYGRWKGQKYTCGPYDRDGSLALVAYLKSQIHNPRPIWFEQSPFCSETRLSASPDSRDISNYVASEPVRTGLTQRWSKIPNSSNQ